MDAWRAQCGEDSAACACLCPFMFACACSCIYWTAPQVCALRPCHLSLPHQQRQQLINLALRHHQLKAAKSRFNLNAAGYGKNESCNCLLIFTHSKQCRINKFWTICYSLRWTNSRNSGGWHSHGTEQAHVSYSKLQEAHWLLGWRHQ